MQLSGRRANYRRFVDERCHPEQNEDGTLTLTIDAHDYQRFTNLRRAYRRVLTARKTVPQSFLISLVSHYDAFLGNLIRAVFYLRPELLNASERALTFKDLVGFSSIQDARDYMVEKEVESLLRDSHISHFEWMEKKFTLTLRTDLPSWPTFVEVTERRNLFAHCNGIVSTQYIKVCKDNGAACKAAVGQELDVTQEYFKRAYDTVFEVGVKLAHVLWRKFQPDARDDADQKLNNVCLDLLTDEEYGLAKTLLEFAVQFKKLGSETSRRIFVLNRAQAYKESKELLCTRCVTSKTLGPSTRTALRQDQRRTRRTRSG